jgi:hypothetical protein
MRHEENSSVLGDSFDDDVVAAVVVAVVIVGDDNNDADDLLPTLCSKLTSSKPTATANTSCSRELLGTTRNVTKSE